MPDECEKALAPTMALFGGTMTPVERRHQAARLGDFLGPDAGRDAEERLARLQGHDDLFQAGVAGAFAQAVNRAFDLPRSGLNRRQRIGHREPQVVLAMRREDRLVDVRDASRRSSGTSPRTPRGWRSPSCPGD